jgi:hypothetical protein
VVCSRLLFLVRWKMKDIAAEAAMQIRIPCGIDRGDNHA